MISDEDLSQARKTAELLTDMIPPPCFTLQRDSAIALSKALCEAIELLGTLAYWHEQGHIDESWWDEAKRFAEGKEPTT